MLLDNLNKILSCDKAAEFALRNNWMDPFNNENLNWKLSATKILADT